MLVISIDGACRRNGKPNCVAAGGVYIEQYNMNCVANTKILTNYEIKSTNQRGEPLALITALDYVWSAKQETQIITDSEYIFNAMTREWFIGWENRGWRTSIDEPVKNSDLWQAIKQTYEKCNFDNINVLFYHIKGHCIPFGKVTANTLLSKDNTGTLLRKEIEKKYELVAHTTRKQNIADAQLLSIKNNGFAMTNDVMKNFVVMNTVADAVATQCVEAADALMA